MCVVYLPSDIPLFTLTGMKWLKCVGELQRKELEKSRAEYIDHFEKLEKKSPECAFAARLEIGILTRNVCTLSSSNAAAYSQQFQV